MLVPWQMAATQIWVLLVLGVDSNQLVPLGDEHYVLT